MGRLTFLSLLASACVVVQLVNAQCSLKGGVFDKPMPDIEKLGVESYQMGVEYTVPGAGQTDYYTEYYDILDRKGRIDSHQSGQTLKHVYRAKTWEAWEITGRACDLKNITDIPEMFKDYQTDWIYFPGNEYNLRTIGPSAMFKNAFRMWPASSKAKKMAYMGVVADKVRGLSAQVWRRCTAEDWTLDYFFTTEEEENPFGLPNLKVIPIRVAFTPPKGKTDNSLSLQQYDIMVFRPFISEDIRPFDLPAGMGCRRGNVDDRPELPSFIDKNLLFSAEVIYRKIDGSGENVQFWSYFSTLKMALDRGSQFIAYYYTPWDTSSSKDDPDVKAPEHIIYDMRHGYAYKTSLEDGKCQIIREKSFVPKYYLPEDAGEIALTDTSLLFPNSELDYLSQGVNRGLGVNIFELTTEGYVLDKGDEKIQIPKAIITHSYLQNDELEDRGGVRNALVQVQLRFTGRFDKVTEILTFNFFGFSTVLRDRRQLFNIRNCYKNDDDYFWATIGFGAEKATLDKVKYDIPSIKSEIVSAISLSSELNAVRIPVVEADFKDDGLYVSMMILGKPPVLLDFLEPVDGKTITGTPQAGGMYINAERCANECLETQTNCWAFSICGAVCAFGTGSVDVTNGAIKTVGEVTDKAGCKLYRRYNNETFIPSRESVMRDLRSEVQNKRINLVLSDPDNNRVELSATSINMAEPDQDDELFDKLGNYVNPRMRVFKVGYKIKKTAGTEVKNLGKLRYDVCQTLCLDFKDCESASFCLKNNECLLTKTFGDDLKEAEMEVDNMCNIVTRNYVDNFVRTPGIVLSTTAQEVLELDTEEKCARACLTQTKYQCLSFDHCQVGSGACKLHTVHYPNAKTRETVQTKNTNCGHYYRKFSTEFKKNPEKRTVGTRVPPLANLTLEECSKTCVEYGKGTCFGFDFCQDKTVLATVCTLLDTDPAQMKTAYSPVCTNYFRTSSQNSPRPYSTGYAGGIGFLCFLVGGLIGALIVFGIAYLKVNRR